MPKGLKLRRNFPYSEFDTWLNSDSKLSFDNFINSHACNAALEIQNTNFIMKENKMIYSKEICSEEKLGLENQILHNHASLDVEDSAELKMDTNINPSDTSKISPKLHDVGEKLSSTDHTLDSEAQNLCTTANTDDSTKPTNSDAFYVVLSSNDSSESSGKKDLKLDDREVRAEKLNFKDILAKSEESVSQDVSPVTNSFDSKICDDQCLNLNTVCVSREDVSEESFNTTAFTISKVLTESNANKCLSSKSDDICENQVEKSVNGMFSSINTDNQKYASETACILHKLCKKQENGARTGLLIIPTSTSPREIQSISSDVLKKSELSDGRDLKLNVPLVDAEKLSFEGIFAKSKEYVPLDEFSVTCSYDPKIRDDQCLNLNTACVDEPGVFTQPFNTTASPSKKNLSEANSDKYYSAKNVNTCENKAVSSINKMSSTANLDHEEDKVQKDLLVNAASSSQNVNQSVDFHVLKKIESPDEEDLKLDSHEACAEKVKLQGTLAKLGESPQHVSPVKSSSVDPKICDDACSNMNTACAFKKDEKPFSTSSIKEELFSETNNDKSLSSKTGNTSENTAEKSVSGMSSISTTSLNDTNAETQTTLDTASISKNKFQLFDFYELEKSDIEDPEWENVKKLKNNEERYKQVRECWDAKNIPNPNKNLTYHSYRKHKLKAGKLDARLIMQHKRQASEKSARPPAKRTRYCTYTVDNQIQSIKSEQFSQTAIIQNELKKQVNMLDYNFNYQVSELKKHYNYHQFDYQNSRNQFMRDRNRLGMQYDQNLHDIKSKYYYKMDTYKAQCQSKIDTLQKAHDEILTFCNFYEGLREDNPTVLTEAQLQEIEEIDDVYQQLNKYYK